MLAARGVRLPHSLFDASDAELLRYADDGGLLNVRLLALVQGGGGLCTVLHMALDVAHRFWPGERQNLARSNTLCKGRGAVACSCPCQDGGAVVPVVSKEAQ